MKYTVIAVNSVMLTALLALGGCSEEEMNPPRAPMEPEDKREETDATGKAKFGSIGSATAEIAATGDKEISGTVTFSPGEDQGVMVVEVDIKGLKPGMHGFHIHSQPDCSDRGKAAGGHFNPQDVRHGAPHQGTYHTGDMGNITADSSGHATSTMKLNKPAFAGLDNILHKPVIVHANADDLQSQPSGQAGPRVACGVILPGKDTLARR